MRSRIPIHSAKAIAYVTFSHAIAFTRFQNAISLLVCLPLIKVWEGFLREKLMDVEKQATFSLKLL